MYPVYPAETVRVLRALKRFKSDKKNYFQGFLFIQINLKYWIAIQMIRSENKRNTIFSTILFRRGKTKYSEHFFTLKNGPFILLA